jgi:glycosyltransferase involved in cell wall biosynthesis
MKPRPLLIVSDSPSCSSGFGRITRELAWRIAADPETASIWRVGCAGWGGTGSQHFPFPEYHFQLREGYEVWELPQIAADFAGEEPLTILAIWDASRLGWLGNPCSIDGGCRHEGLYEWLRTKRPQKWIYHPIDAVSESSVRTDILGGFDRVLAYTAFGADQTGYPDHLPHGIDTSVWQPRNRVQARTELCKSFTGLKPDALLLGVVATNQARKDWRLAAETCRILLERGHDVRLWAHTDAPRGWWDLPRLFADHGMEGRAAITTFQLSDAQMTWMYSACDVTLGIGLGEGFGYPIFESLACGVPCVAVNYVGAAEFLDGKFLENPTGYYWEGPGCAQRPTLRPDDWAVAVSTLMDKEWTGVVTLPPELDWTNLWPRWKQWLLAGASC